MQDFLMEGLGLSSPRSHNLTRFKPLSTERKENMKNVKILKLGFFLLLGPRKIQTSLSQRKNFLANICRISKKK